MDQEQATKEHEREKSFFISNHQRLDVVEEAELVVVYVQPVDTVDESRMSLGDAFANVWFLDHDLDP